MEIGDFWRFGPNLGILGGDPDPGISGKSGDFRGIPGIPGNLGILGGVPEPPKSGISGDFRDLGAPSRAVLGGGPKGVWEPWRGRTGVWDRSRGGSRSGVRDLQPLPGFWGFFGVPRPF